jgi:hypothetical protein
MGEAMLAGVLFNRDSHQSSEKLSRIGKEIESLLRHHRMVVHPVYGARYLPAAQQVEDTGTGKGYKEELRMAVIALIRAGAEVIITVGGDGLASYTADAAIAFAGGKTPIPALLGIAAGTANVGPIVSLNADDLPAVRWEDLKPVPTDAVEVWDGQTHVGYGFNDVILGNSLLATLEGKVCNVSVQSLVEFDRLEPVDCGVRIAAPSFQVLLNGQPIPWGNDSRDDPSRIKQIVVSPLQFDRCYGRAILGGLCCGDQDMAGQAALGLCSRAVVDSNPAHWQEPGFISIAHLLFSPGDTVTLSGLGADAHIVIDGNPWLRTTETLMFQSIPGAVTVLRREAGKRSDV